jgi:hypothetical protein
MKYDGKCLHGACAESAGNCAQPRKEGSVLCEHHHELWEAGLEKAPPLRMTRDYVATGPRFLVVDEEKP